jgi:hypothetical protein
LEEGDFKLEDSPEAPNKLLWVVEFSPAQRAFNIGTLEEILTRNIQLVVEGAMLKEFQNPGYIFFGLFADRAQAESSVERLREMLNKQGAGL